MALKMCIWLKQNIVSWPSLQKMHCSDSYRRAGSPTGCGHGSTTQWHGVAPPWEDSGRAGLPHYTVVQTPAAPGAMMYSGTLGVQRGVNLPWMPRWHHNKLEMACIEWSLKQWDCSARCSAPFVSDLWDWPSYKLQECRQSPPSQYLSCCAGCSFVCICVKSAICAYMAIKCLFKTAMPVQVLQLLDDLRSSDAICGVVLRVYTVCWLAPCSIGLIVANYKFETGCCCSNGFTEDVDRFCFKYIGSFCMHTCMLLLYCGLLEK